MSFFYKEEKFNSAVNGELVLRKFWDGSWILKIPEGENYSSTYLSDMWKKSLKKVRKLKFSKVLILGSGAGCGVDQVHKFFPEAEIQAVDYDPMIMAVGQKIFKYFDQTPLISFFVSEAQKFIENSKEQYDLILIDLFVGNTISPLVKNEDFVQCLKDKTLDGAVIIINAASHLTGVDQKIFITWREKFSYFKTFSFYSNKLILVEKRPKKD